MNIVVGIGKYTTSTNEQKRKCEKRQEYGVPLTSFSVFLRIQPEHGPFLRCMPRGYALMIYAAL